MAEDLGTRPEDARVAALIAAAERLATPLDLDRLDRRPVRRGGVLAAIVVAGALVVLVAVTALSGGGDATADDTSTPTTVVRSAGTRADAPATTDDVVLAASAGPVSATSAPRRTDATDAASDPTARDRSPSLGASPASSPNASLPGASTTTQPTASTAPPVPNPGNLPGSPPASSPGGIFSTAGNAATLGAGGAAPAATRSIVFADGVLHLGGPVPDRDTADELEANVAVAAFGRALISAEYVVDDDATDPTTDVLTTEGTTLFLPESEDITPAAAALLDFGAALLLEHPRMTWTVEVHTDNLGSDEYNLTLSQRRADAIVAALVARGAQAAQLVAVGKGEGEPIADNATRPGREANRRVEIEIDGLLG